MLSLYLEAPFAAFRTFTAGWYRPTATFLTPSAAYGLLLNFAGVESRLREEDEGHPGGVPASLMRTGLPAVELALGVPAFRLVGRSRREEVPPEARFPRVQTVYQQLHNYPVGQSGADRAEEAHGNKYNITPVRREFLSDFRAVVRIRGDESLEERIRLGLTGAATGRYGVPFLGDNSFLLDRADVLEGAGPVCWYERISAESSGGVRDRATRLTVLIDRADLSRTTSHLYAPGEASLEPAAAAWTRIDPPAPPSPSPPPRRKRS